MALYTKFKSISKANWIALLVIIILILSIVSVSLARFNNRVMIDETPTWDGTIASKYRAGNGSVGDPYVIADGSELAYFAEMLKTTDYDNTYFVLKNDIIINKGLWSYDEDNKIQYRLGNDNYFVKDGTGEYYSTVDYSNLVGTVNIFESLDNFKGTLDGKFYRIYGLYINNNSDNVGLFSSIQGTVKNLYLENALIKGQKNVGLLAGSISDGVIENVLVNGFAIGNEEFSSVTEEITISNQAIILNSESKESTFDLNSLMPIINGNVVSTKLIGNLNANDDANVTINGIKINNGEFDIDLGANVVDSLNLALNSNTIEDVTINNLRYVVAYNDSLVGGISGIARNVTFKNVVNKGSVNKGNVTGGLFAFGSGSLSVNNSYNVGNINGDVLSAGLFGVIDSEESITINNVYNGGSITGVEVAGLVGDTKDSTITINNSLEITHIENVIGNLNNNVIVNNSYYVAENVINDEGFIYKSITELANKNFWVEQLGFKEYINAEQLNSDSTAVWCFDDDIPILFIDDATSGIVSININNYSWNNFSEEVVSLQFSQGVTYNITNINDLVQVKDIYYYISDKVISRAELVNLQEWTLYDGVGTLNNEGKYIIYAKAVGYDGKESYLNSDMIIINFSQYNLEVKINDYKWSSLRTDLNKYFVNDEVLVEISCSEQLINGISYFISNEVLDEQALNDLNDSLWITYNGPFNINLDNQIVYVKAVNEFGYTTYVNTDLVVYDGFVGSKLSAGRNNEMNLNNLNISNKSSFSMNFSFTNEMKYTDSVKRYLLSNVLLPVGTKITLINNHTNKVYTYYTENNDYGFNDSAVATYDFELFKEIGSVDKYLNIDNTGSINEDWKIIIDFKDCTISEDITNLTINMGMDLGNNLNISTLSNSIKYINVYNDVNSDVSINSNFSDVINYNSDSITDVEIVTSFVNKNINGEIIYDTFNEDMFMGIVVELKDNEGNKVSKDALKNIEFVVDDVNYYPNDNGVVYVNSNMDNDFLRVITYKDKDSVLNGDYYLDIKACVANRSDSCILTSTNSVHVDVKAEIVEEINYGFDVKMDNNARIIEKDNTIKNLNFKIAQNGNLNNPNIRVKFYVKNQANAYDHTYTLIDLNDFSDLNLVNAGGMSYYVTQNPVVFDGTENTYNIWNLQLDSSKLDFGAYKICLELFDGSKKIDDIERIIIVK